MTSPTLVLSGQKAAAFARNKDAVRHYQSQREALIEHGREPSEVREEIQVSWRRSLLSGVSPDSPETPRLDNLELSSRFLEAARPTMERVWETLVDTDFSLLLLDRRGWVLDRRVGSPKLTVRLDDNLTAPGYSLAEQFAGTNGPGTALEMASAVQITGPEHFADRYQDLTCAAVPVFNPTTGKLEGAVNLTCPFRQTNPLMLPFAAGAAAEIQRSLASQVAHRERVLLQEFLSACHRASGPVVSLSENVLMSNPAAARLFDGVDQNMLWERAAAAARTVAGVTAWQWETAAGERLQMRSSPVYDGSRLLGAVIEATPLTAEPRRPRSAAPPAAPLPGVVVGRNRAMLELARVASRVADTRTPCVIVGEPGVGKLALARAVVGLRADGPDPVFLDGATTNLVGSSEWLATAMKALDVPDHALVVAHLDALDDVTARTLAACIDAHDNYWVVATTRGNQAQPGSGYGALLDRLTVMQVEVPPLRSRLEDLPALVDVLLARFGRPGQQLRPAVLHALARLDWPGNVRELANVVKWAARSTTGSTIEVSDMPSSVLKNSTARHLTPIERAELDTIVQALKDAEGNKLEAAKHLGLARSTLYRKLRSYGLDVEQTIF